MLDMLKNTKGLDIELNKENFYSDPRVIAHNVKSFRIPLSIAVVIGFLLFVFYSALQLTTEDFDAWRIAVALVLIVTPVLVVSLSASIPSLYPQFPKIFLVLGIISFVALVDWFLQKQQLNWLIYLICFYLLGMILVSPVVQMKYLVAAQVFFLGVINFFLLKLNFATSVVVIFNAQFITLVCASLMISQRHQINTYRTLKMMISLHRMSTMDSMTKVYNRRAWHDQLVERCTASGRKESSVTVLLLDLDHFKNINDTYGHQTGDEVIKTFAKVCQRNIRSYDSVGRLGGEEFGILLPNTSVQEALSIAQRILEDMQHQIFQAEEKTFSVTVSIGLSQFSPKIRDETELFKRADDALYRAKESGRNQVRLADE